MKRASANVVMHRRHAVHGFSVVELMVAVAIGLIILVAITDAFTSNSATGTTNTRFTEVQANARFAADFLKREIQHGGLFSLSTQAVNTAAASGCQVAEQAGSCPVVWDGATATTDYGCGAGFAVNLMQWIFGTDDANTLGCIAADYARGDVLVLRRTGRCVNAIPAPCPEALAANKLYVRTEFMKAIVFQGTTAPPYTQPPYEDFALEASVYYIAPCSNSPPLPNCGASGADNIPSLKRLTLGAGPAMTMQIVAPGIENLQLQYGVQFGPKDTGTLVFKDAGAMNAADWPSVAAVRLWVLARSSDAEYAGFTNTSQYDMGNHNSSQNPIVMNDRYVRQMHQLVVNLRK